MPVRTADPLARSLGLASLAGGAVLLRFPAPVLRRVGLHDTSGARLIARVVGVREAGVGLGILASRRPVGWLWARVGGDGLELALLVLAAGVQGHPARSGALARWHSTRSVRPETGLALGAVAGIGIIDLVAATRLTRRRGPHRSASGSILVDLPRTEVYQRWRQLQEVPRFFSHLDLRPARTGHRPATPPVGMLGRTTLPAPVGPSADVVREVPSELIEWRSGIASAVDHAGTARFEPTSDGHGTRVTVQVDFHPPGGLVGSLVAGLFGEHPRQQIADDLVRFKRLVEGDPLRRSDHSGSDHSGSDQSPSDQGASHRRA